MCNGPIPIFDFNGNLRRLDFTLSNVGFTITNQKQEQSKKWKHPSSSWPKKVKVIPSAE
ncbi:unnamed protein product [Clavelina lepadiformis]|uniref:Uncharacterized protein n=1 Tax=Clavelina lepadiformis TaxID=159417 RepID=A0ABP0F6J9_CLALP